MNNNSLFANFKADFSSGLVVFLVALPLCLGIAMASGAPLFSGIISGIVGGIVIGFLSQSHISVSGPAAGLTAIVLTAITDLGSFELFLTAVFVAGLIQLMFGFLRAGKISSFFPLNVIEGMLGGIGVIIILKQLPHAFGYDPKLQNTQAILQSDSGSSFSFLIEFLNKCQFGPMIVTIVSFVILISWEKIGVKNLKIIPGALIAVLMGIVLNEIFIQTNSPLVILNTYLVTLPVPESLNAFADIIVTPNFSGVLNPKVWIVGGTVAIVASIETLLCIEATDRMDAQKRYTDPNVELKAQGIGNIVSSLIGGLPMTSVVVRSTANNNAGAKSKLSAIIHGILLLISVLSIPTLLNKIPLATLATVLILVGYKLAKPATFIHFWQKGIYQFIPFVVTMVAVVATDLLKGVALGMVISMLFKYLSKKNLIDY